MTVHQVEEFYVHIDYAKGSIDTSTKMNIRQTAEREGFEVEFQPDYLIVDNIDSEDIAENLNDEIRMYISQGASK